MRNAIPVRRMLVLAAIGALCIALAVNVQGCTAIGFAIGAAADARDGSGGPALLLDVKVGRPVTLLLWDGRTLEGRFAGWSRDSVDSLALTDSLASTRTSSPRGATVRLATDRGEIAVPAESIAKVSVTVNRGKIGGLLTGLAADAIVITAARSAVRPHPGGCEGQPVTMPW
jgi:hypothetical protein